MKSLRLIVAILWVFVIGLCVITIGRQLLGTARVDLTNDQIYSMKSGTKNIISSLNQPVKLKLYYSKVSALKGPEEMRQWNGYYKYVLDLLTEYEKISNGNIILEVIDPRTYSDAEADAERYGLLSFPLGQNEKFYFGLVVETDLGKLEVINMFDPQRRHMVEYDVTQAVYNILERERTKIGVITELPIMGAENMNPQLAQMLAQQGRPVPQPWVMISHLRYTYEVVKIDSNAAKIPEDIDFLMVIHPKLITKNNLFAIDQYVMHNGRVAVFLDPHSVNDLPERPSQMAMMSWRGSSDLNVLLEKWGIKMDKNQIVLDNDIAMRAPLQRGGEAQALLPYLRPKKEVINTEHPALMSLEMMQLGFAGVLKQTDVPGVTVTPLLETSGNAAVWKPDRPYMLNQPNFPGLIDIAKKADKQKHMMAALLTGQFSTNFPDGFTFADTPTDMATALNAPATQPKQTFIESRKVSGQDAMVLVVSDADLLSDNFTYRRSITGYEPISDNHAFVFNMLDFMSGSHDLISIRPTNAYRTFTYIEVIEKQAEKDSAKEEEELDKKKEDAQQELAKLQGQDMQVVVSAVREKIEELQKTQREIDDKKRKIQNIRREKVEAEKLKFQLMTILAAPAIILFIAILIWIVRLIKAYNYATRRV